MITIPVQLGYSCEHNEMKRLKHHGENRVCMTEESFREKSI